MRKSLINKRKSINLETKSYYVRKITENFINKFSNFKYSNIASYKATSDEINPHEIELYLTKNNNTIYYPIIHPYQKRLLWFSKDTNLWIKNRFQILEPKMIPKEILAPWEIDVVIIPVLGFNREKYRLGMGGGFYDTSFSFKKNNLLLIGIAFDEQLSEGFKNSAWDLKLNYIITPSKII